MFGIFRKSTSTAVTQHDARLVDLQGQVDAIHRVQAVIEFALDGTILTANANFLTAMGYTLQEVQGRHHRLFVAADYAEGPAYREFWARLGRGEFDAGRYRRLAKGGREIWIQASYNPVLDAAGRPVKVVKFATDITAQMLEAADHAGQLEAISKAQAVIEFGLDGRILGANDNFLAALGYAMDEIRGQHHAMFVDPAERQGEAYRQFWRALGRGEFSAGRYKRLAKGGREVWIQATYNPIFDMAGRPFKVVKYATDITAQVRAELALQRAVAQTRDVVSAAQAGDLTGRVPLDGKDGAIADLCEGVNALVESTAGVIGRIKGAADLVRDASREISAGNQDLAQRTEEQAASLEETAASMEELTTTVRHNTENAHRASQVAAQTCEVATRGGSAVAGVVGVMDQISLASRRITDIIGVIDGIAFQTNILALNAAVEAARAGEQGRGFAVVAAEVRTLAQRAAGAAKEIKGLIDDSSQKVQAGTALVHSAGATMEEIVGSVKHVSELIAQIATASAEQNAGVAQMTQTIGAMDEGTQQNAAMVEEVTSSARSLEDQAGELAEIVANFRVHAGDASGSVVALAARRERKGAEAHAFATGGRGT